MSSFFILHPTLSDCFIPTRIFVISWESENREKTVNKKISCDGIRGKIYKRELKIKDRKSVRMWHDFLVKYLYEIIMKET